MSLTRPKFAQVDTTFAAFSDPITILHQGATVANVDVGFLFNRANGLVSNVALYWNEETGRFITAYTSSSGDTYSNVTATSFANIQSGNVFATGFFYANGAAFISGSNYGNTDVAAYLPLNSTIFGIQANLGSYQGWANTRITTLDANLGTVTTNITTLFSNAAGQANQITGANAAIVTANSAVVSFVGTVNNNLSTAITANTNAANAAIVTANSAVVSFIGTVNNNLSTAITANTNAANAAIVTANTGLKSYVDTQDSAITSAWTANAAGQANQITGANAAIVTANSAVVSFVGMVNSNLSTAITANTNAANAAIITANSAVVSFVGTVNNNLSTAITANTNAANTAATTANTNMKSYVDTQDSAITTAWTSNAATQATSINTINANVGSYYQYANANLGTATTNITTLFSNAATQATSLNSINANLGTATTNITNLQSNAGTQQSQINSIVTNANANVAAYLPTYSGSLGGTLTTAAQTNITSVGTLTGLTSSGIVNITNSTQSNDNTTGALVVTGGAAVGANLHVGGSLHVTGNLEVNGTQTIFNTNVSVIEDSLIYMGDDNTGDSVDIGLVSSFTNPAYQHTGFVRDASDGVWKLFANVVAEPTTVVDFTDATYSPLRIGQLISNSAVLSGVLQIAGIADVAANLATTTGRIVTVEANLGTATTNITTLFSNAAGQANQITGANAAIVTANSAVVSFVGTVNNNLSTAITANTNAANAAIVTANTSLKSYVDTQDSAITTAWTANATTQATSINTINANLGAYQNTTNANIGTLFLGNASTQANLGAFEAYANAKIGTNTNSNLVVVATTTSTSTTTGALVIAGGAGIAGNLNVGGTLNTFSGNVGIGATPDANFHVSSGSAKLRIGLTSSNQYLDIYRDSPTGFAIYNAAQADPYRAHIWQLGGTEAMRIATSGNVAISTTTASTSSTTGALVVKGGVGVAGQLTVASNISLSESGGAGTRTILSSSGSGAIINHNDNSDVFLQTQGNTRIQILNGSGIVSFPYGITANSSGIRSTFANIITSNGVYWANGAAYSSGSGGGITYTASATTPVSPSAGNFWYDTSTDIKYQYIYDGAGSYWEDLSYPTSFGNLTVANTLTVNGSIIGTVTNTNYSLAANVAIYESVTATTTNATFYPMLSGITTGNTASFTASGLTFNPSTGALGATTVSATTLTGTLSTAAQTNITSVGTLTSLNVGAQTNTGLITGRTGTGGVAAVSNDAGSLSVRGDATNAAVISFHRPSIYAINMGLDTDNVFKIGGWSATANVFQLTGAGVLTIASTINSNNLLLQGDGTNAYVRPTNSGSLYLGANNTNIAVVNTTGILPVANVTYNLGSATAWWNLVYGKSVQAQYADLAEHYAADADYPPGTVVVFGGSAEITVSGISHDPRVAGVISTNPAYLMNAANAGLPVALTGRVPCQVQGPVAKGDRLVNIDTGVAGRLNPALHEYGCIVGKSLGEIADDSIQTIEIVVGRF